MYVENVLDTHSLIITLITHSVVNFYPMFQNGPYHLECFILVHNLCPMFQNGPYPLKCFILVINTCNLV
jgi:hypothetical protein